jgi:hypothetical protein
MIVELILKEQPKLEPKGYEKIEFQNGIIFSSSVEGRVGVIIKKHPDGRVSVFTDKSEVIKSICESSEVIDIHVK